jgi:hypothetical protein
VVVDVMSKPAVHDNPLLLSHTIDWHLHVAAELGHRRAEAHEVPLEEEEERREAA